VYIADWNRLRSHAADGSLNWIAFNVNGNSLSDPDVGPDGTIYVVRNGINLHALAPDGSTKWTFVNATQMLSPVPSPAGGVVLVGGAPNGQPGSIEAVDEDGSPLWSIALPVEPNGPFSTWDVKPQGRPRFADDGSVAYVMATGPSSPDSTSYVYAVQVAPIAALGYGLAGTHGVPRLEASGSLTSGSPLSISTSDLVPGNAAWMVIGLDILGVPFREGVMVPRLDVLLPYVADAGGGIALASTWPSGLPPGTSIYVQSWATDSGGPAGFAASQALSLITP
jgi:hypothetical protein